MAFRFQFYPQAVTVAEESLADLPEFIGELPIAQQLIAQIEDQGPLTVKELVGGTDLNESSVRTTLSKKGNGFRKAGSSKWTLE